MISEKACWPQADLKILQLGQVYLCNFLNLRIFVVVNLHSVDAVFSLWIIVGVSDMFINRPGVAGAVLQTASLPIN